MLEFEINCTRKRAFIYLFLYIILRAIGGVVFVILDA